MNQLRGWITRLRPGKKSRRGAAKAKTPGRSRLAFNDDGDGGGGRGLIMITKQAE